MGRNINLVNFCKDCPHCKVESKLKKIFNEKVENVFITCPIEPSDNIAGCFIKNLSIDWNGFEEFVRENGLQD